MKKKLLLVFLFVTGIFPLMSDDQITFGGMNALHAQTNGVDTEGST